MDKGNGAVAVLGVNSLKRKFDRMGKIDITKPTRWSMLLVQQSARKKVRKKTRTLERSIRAKLMKGDKGTTDIQGKVFTNVEYAPPLEFGVNHSYVIRPVKAKALYWDGANHPVKKVVMPPRKPYPFMKPALKDNEQAVRQAFITHYKEMLSKLSKG